jgi:hypothetical protein
MRKETLQFFPGLKKGRQYQMGEGINPDDKEWEIRNFSINFDFS